MILTQTSAIFVDAYRALRARKMFWIVLALSGLVMAGFAAFGIDESGLKFIVWRVSSSPNTHDISPAVMYKWIFTNVALDTWLAWIASILALISTAGIFPELISSGSIDLLLAKPIGRVRLFLTEYVAGLLFVVLQVFLFSLASFLLIGIRGGEWEPGLFLAVPLVVCFFSYLFSVCVFLGLLTRSTVAALLLTLLFWFVLYGLNTADTGLLMFKLAEENRAAIIQRDLGSLQAHVETLEALHEQPTTRQAKDIRESRTRIDSLQEKRRRALGTAEKLGKVQRVIYLVKSFLPKTDETVMLTERVLISVADLPTGKSTQVEPGQTYNYDRPDPEKAGKALAKSLRSRSVAWVLGTSLAFELVFLAWGAVIFCRRDF